VSLSGLRSAAREVVSGARRQLVGRDLALISAGLTFYAGIAVVPLLVLAFSLTARLSSPARVQELGARLAELLPAELGAPDAVSRLVQAGVGLSLWGGILALLPMSLYGEGLRRALNRFSGRREGLTGWRGRAAALPVLLVAPLLLYPLLLTVPVMADLAETGGAGPTCLRIAIGFYGVLAALTVPLAWGFRVVGGGRVSWPALVAGALLTAACVSGFLQGFVLFLALPLDLGAPFGGLSVVGGVVAVGFWLFLLHLVVLGGWLFTQSLDEHLARRQGGGGRTGPGSGGGGDGDGDGAGGTGAGST
jgi:membrane protein